MSEAVVVLSVCQHPILLATRNSVLEKAGFRVISAVDARTALAVITSQAVHVVVLGDGLNAPLYKQVAKQLRAVDPFVPLVIIGYTHSEPSTTDFQVGSLDGPEVLIATVHRAAGGYKRGAAAG